VPGLRKPVPAGVRCKCGAVRLRVNRQNGRAAQKLVVPASGPRSAAVVHGPDRCKPADWVNLRTGG
jgi:hypothetical protein